MWMKVAYGILAILLVLIFAFIDDYIIHHNKKYFGEIRGSFLDSILAKLSLLGFHGIDITVRVPLNQSNYNSAMSALFGLKYRVRIQVPRSIRLSDSFVEDVYDDLNKRVLRG